MRWLIILLGFVSCFAPNEKGLWNSEGAIFWAGNISLVDTAPAHPFEVRGEMQPIGYSMGDTSRPVFTLQNGVMVSSSLGSSALIDTLCIGRGHVPLRDYYGPISITLEYVEPSPPRLVDNDSISYRVIEEERQATYTCQRCHKEYTITVLAIIDTIWKR